MKKKPGPKPPDPPGVNFDDALRLLMRAPPVSAGAKPRKPKKKPTT